MSYIIDRRLNGKNKSSVNRQRFLRRYRNHIKKAVSDAVKQRSITDLESGSEITIPSRDLSEPVFHHGPGGVNTRVFPGNKEFVPGDEIQRPRGGGAGGGGGKASNSGEGEDEFVFQIDRDEFLEFLFEDLELPHMVKKQLADSSDYKTVQAGFTNQGNPERLNIVRSLRGAHARRIALSGSSRRQIKALEREKAELLEQPADDARDIRLADIDEELELLRAKVSRMPFLDTFDLKFNNLIKTPVPSSKAVMFCVMDVSGSMTQSIKDMAKRFFLLLYMFLKRAYKRIDVVFIRHHTQAKEVDEEEFFYSRETGGTIVSSAIALTAEVIEARYPPGDWNIYVAQASDGDNWDGDSDACRDLLLERIMPKVQYFSYVEITTGEHQNLWFEYERVREAFPDVFAMEKIETVGDIYPVFRELFSRREQRTG
ncbi:YeaH/YhbH family protein [Motiliproteus sp. SC1-56]|uniref:YeaH/YhbH family protein n=1 Tax=Motiliproteus sp. SC1-56 TaxID=2799565 RepID=UPI001A8FEB72|nr:YeaH/YhbH family protein [Motiliproteus sp. SC1-56]